MMAGFQCEGLLVGLAMVAAMAVLVSSESQLLNEMLTKVAQARAGLEPAKLATANELGQLVGYGRMRNMVLRLNYDTELRFVKSYNEDVWRQTLRQTSDVDAVTELLKKLAHTTDHQLASASDSERAELIDQHLVPACLAFVEALRPVFERELEAEQEQQLAEAIHENARKYEVKEMVETWADYGTCKTLVGRDRSKLIDRIPKRIEDNKRIAAKRLARQSLDQNIRRLAPKRPARQYLDQNSSQSPTAS